MYHHLRTSLAFVFLFTLFTNAHADGIVSKVVSSPLSVVGAVQGERTGINIYLQNEAAPGVIYMDPKVIGYGIAPAGRLEVELNSGFKRDTKRKLDSTELRDAAIILVTGTPQQGLLGKKAGYKLADGRRNHNWQRIASGETLGHAAGSVPLTLMLFEKPGKTSSRQGIIGAGVISTQQLKAMKFKLPKELARYTGGLIVKDTDANGRMDPTVDRIVGGVIGSAPKGAKGQEARSLIRDGVATLSRPTAAFEAGPGKRFGGAVMQVEFTAGNKPGLYSPTFALLRDASDPMSGDGSSYTYTIVVK